MKNVETILAKLASKNKAYDALTKAYNLLKNDKTEEAKDIINLAIKSGKDVHNPANILYRILAMVHKLNESTYSFDDIMEYHYEYRGIIDISGFADTWVYGDNEDEINEVSEAVVSMASDMLPDLYSELLTYVSKFDTNSMIAIHEYIEYSLVKPVSEMMMAIEQIDVYNIHYLLNIGKTVKSIFEACDKLEDSE